MELFNPVNGFLINEFSIKPGDRVRLYRARYGLSLNKMKQTFWYRSCGRKILFQSEAQAAMVLAEWKEPNPPRIYQCKFVPCPHWHLGHEATSVATKELLEIV